MLKLRPATIADLPPIVALVEDYKDKYLDDFTEITPEDIKGIVLARQVLVVDEASYPVGAFWVEPPANPKNKMWIGIHLLMRPEYTKRIRRARLIEQVFDLLFQNGYEKITAEPLEFQKSTIKLLKRMKFKFTGYRKNHTRKNGRNQNLEIWELCRKYWDTAKTLDKTE